MHSTALLYVLGLLAANYLEWSQCTVTCKKTATMNDRGDSQKFETCQGDWCVKNIIVPSSVTQGQQGANGRPAVPMITYGCFTGFEMQAGCFMDTWNSTACFCQDQDMCNEKTNLSANAVTKSEVTCYNGLVKDGRLLGNRTCKGVMCQVSYADSVTGTPAEIVASCVYDLIPTFSSAPGCLLFANTLGGNDTWNCRCRTNLCNSPADFTAPARSNAVTCSAGFVNANMQPSPSQPRQQTCTGDFCVLTPMGEPPVIYSKSCMSVSNGAKVSPKRFRFDLVKSTDIYVCSSEMCNEDLDKVVRSFGGNQGNETTGQPTGNETTVVVVEGGNTDNDTEEITTMSGVDVNATENVPTPTQPPPVISNNDNSTAQGNNAPSNETAPTTEEPSTGTTQKLKDKPSTPKSGSSIAASIALTLFAVVALKQF